MCRRLADDHARAVGRLRPFPSREKRYVPAMPRIERNATVIWEGNVARGAGQITAGTGAFGGLPYSLPTRVGAGDEAKTSPEELLAAAHAGCYAMGLASELTKLGAPPQVLEVR